MTSHVPASTPFSPTPVVLQRGGGYGGTCDSCREETPLGSAGGVRLGPRDDAFEREADHMADRIVGGGLAGIQRQPINGEEMLQSRPDGLQRQPEDEEEMMQLKAVGPANASAIPAAAGAVASGGRALVDAERAYFEPRFGRDLSHVRVHTDEPAAQGIGARAYTLRNHIAFAPGQFDAASSDGRRLIAHELSHTFQQGGTTILRRDAAPGNAVAPPAPEVVEGTERGEADELDFAFVFTGGNYGRNATAFIERYYPDHELIRSTNFEAMFDTLYSRMRASRRGGRDPHLRELVIVTHANAAGGLQIPLTRGTGRRPEGFFNLWSLSELQEDFRNDLHERFQRRRREVVSDLFDESTRVVVRGCEFGQAPEAMDALRTFFGGDAWVWAPTGFQGYETLRIGGERLPTPEAAFDFLIKQEYLPPELEPIEDESKREYIARVFGLNGTVPATFFVMGREHYDALRSLDRQGRGTSVDAEEHKDRDETTLESVGEHWSLSDPGILGRPIPELDSLSLEELEARGRALMQNYRPQIAYLVVRLRQAWERKGMEVLRRCQGDPDPLCGLPPTDAFGDSNLVGPDARRFPGPNIDAFETTEIVAPDETAAADAFDEGLGFGTPESPRRANPSAARTTPGREGGRGSGRPTPGARGGRAAATNFDKSTGQVERRPPTVSEPDPVDVQALIDALTNEEDREAAQEILDRMPQEGWTTSNYLDAAQLSINVATAPLTFVEGVAATFAIEAGGIVLGGVLSIVGFFVTLEESRQAQAEAAQALGVELGYERLLGQVYGDRITGEVSAEDMKEGLTNDYRVVSQIRYNIPHAGRTALPNIEIGVDAVADDANRVLRAADQALRERLVTGGLQGEELETAFRAAQPVVRRRFINEMIRQGGAAIARRKRILEARQ